MEELGKLLLDNTSYRRLSQPVPRRCYLVSPTWEELLPEVSDGSTSYHIR